MVHKDACTCCWLSEQHFLHTGVIKDTMKEMWGICHKTELMMDSPLPHGRHSTEGQGQGEDQHCPSLKRGVHRQIRTLQHQPEPPDISMDTKEKVNFRIRFTPQRVFKHRGARTNPRGLHTREASQGCLSAFLQDMDAETESTCEHRPVALCQPLKDLAFN